MCLSLSPERFRDLGVLSFLSYEILPACFFVSSQHFCVFRRSTHGYSDSYALGCSIGRVLFCGHNRRKGSCGGATGCLPDQQAVRADTASLEYVLWKMTAPNHAKRFSDLDEIATALARTTHMFDLSSDGDSDSGKESVQY